MAKRIILILLLTLHVGCQRDTPVSPVSPGPLRDSELSAELTGRQLILRPSGISLSLPQDWLEWNQKFKNNLHITADTLPSVHSANSEWDPEYAMICNNMFPYSRCVVHVGGEGWGADGASFGDMQMRIYHLKTDLQHVQTKINEIAPTLLEKLNTDENSGWGDHPTYVLLKTENGWQRSLLRYGRFYHDYGGTANVEVVTRSLKSGTLVVVLMYCDRFDERDTIENIIGSFSGFQTQSSGD